MKFRKTILALGIAAAALALPATAASASVASPHPQGNQCQQYNGKHDDQKNQCCPQYGQKNQKNNKNKDSSCACPKGHDGMQSRYPQDCQPQGNQDQCQGNQDCCQKDRDQGSCGNQNGCQHQQGDCGNGNQNGSGCKPVTFSNSSAGGASVTELAGGPKLTSGEEVSYGSPATDYWVIDVSGNTFELSSTAPPAITVHTEGINSDWQLTTACGQGSQGNGNR